MWDFARIVLGHTSDHIIGDADVEVLIVQAFEDVDEFMRAARQLYPACQDSAEGA
jgi:hypothetical protein